MPKCRSVSIIVTVPAITGSVSRIMNACASSDQQNSGSRLQPMPGARMLAIVTVMFSAPRIELSPVRWIRKIQASVPLPGMYGPVESGVYEVQPASGGEKNTAA